MFAAGSGEGDSVSGTSTSESELNHSISMMLRVAQYAAAELYFE